MKILTLDDIKNTEREVRCPKGGFVSYRFLLKKDNMGFSMHKTIIPKGDEQHWNYKNHLEACYCVCGKGILTDLKSGKKYSIVEDVVYVLDDYDDHLFLALEDVILICIFTPPIVGNEVHDENGVYKLIS